MFTDHKTLTTMFIPLMGKVHEKFISVETTLIYVSFFIREHFFGWE